MASWSIPYRLVQCRQRSDPHFRKEAGLTKQGTDGFGPDSGRNIPWLATTDAADEAELTLSFDDNRLASSLFGQYDQNLAFIEKRLRIQAAARGNLVTLIGSPELCEQAKAVLENLYGRLKTGHDISLGDVDGAIRMTTSQGSLFEPDGEPRLGHEEIVTRKRRVRARTPAQDSYIRALKRNELVFGIGPAGTGKTWLAVAQAVALLDKGLVDRMILTRPAVEAGERLGFLPGDMKEKVDPYLRPIYDALYDLMDAPRVERGLQSTMIEIAPLAFMRGRTLTNAVVILDEAQNTTSMQMKMFLTRLGENSRMIITGDPTQVDLPPGMKSGLSEALDLLDGVPGIAQSYFSEDDVVRHELVGRIVKAYEAATRSGEHAAPHKPRRMRTE
jgi:phosphate starvation-inducible PhoH-like protein